MSGNAAGFSPSLTLAGMDYIAPSAACIKPTLINQAAAAATAAAGSTGNSGGVVGVQKGGNTLTPASGITRNGGGAAAGAHADVVKITLQDCLACSGCVTTAETVLVNAQSCFEIISTLLGLSNTPTPETQLHDRSNNGNGKHIHTAQEITAAEEEEEAAEEVSLAEVHGAGGASTSLRMRPRLVSISRQSCASLAAYLDMTMDETYSLIAGFMRAALTPAALQEQAAAAAHNEEAGDSGKSKAADGDQRMSNDAAAEAQQEEEESSPQLDQQQQQQQRNSSPRRAAHEEPPIYVIDLEWAEQLSAALTAQEYHRRRTNPSPETLPMIVSACPGWVCYCEKQGSALLPHLCPVMSAQGIAGSYAKRIVQPDLYHISIQPCFDRKLEAARDAMPPSTPSNTATAMAEEEDASSAAPVFYTDCVLSTAELLEWMKEVDPQLPWRDDLDTHRGTGASHALARREDVTVAKERNEEAATTEAVVVAAAHDAARLAGSGGYHQSVMADRLRRVRGPSDDSPMNVRTSSAISFPATKVDIAYEVKRNRNHQLATCAELPGEVFCIGYGFQQIQNVVRGLKKKMPAMRSYTFIELMACPDGCLNGGGQVRPALQPHNDVLDAVIRAYAAHIDRGANDTSTHAAAGQPNNEPTAADARANENAEPSDEASTRRRRLEEKAQLVGTSDTAAAAVAAAAATGAPFAYATMAAVVPLLGPDWWCCAFRDREKEFAEMLNAGNIHSLKW